MEKYIGENLAFLNNVFKWLIDQDNIKIMRRNLLSSHVACYKTYSGHDQRLERTMESSLMVMEALEGYSERLRYDIMVSYCLPYYAA